MSLEVRYEINRDDSSTWVKIEVSSDGGATWTPRVEGYLVPDKP